MKVSSFLRDRPEKQGKCETKRRKVSPLHGSETCCRTLTLGRMGSLRLPLHRLDHTLKVGRGVLCYHQELAAKMVPTKTTHEE